MSHDYNMLYEPFILAVPRDVNYMSIKHDLADINGVKAVHSLNVWSLTMDKVAVAVHLAAGIIIWSTGFWSFC